MTRETPWVEHPLRVPPERIYWQVGDEGPKPISTSPHAKGAREILAGTPPGETAYAREICDEQAGCHGKPAAFAALISSMREVGYKGEGVIAGINRRGEVVLHDGMHRSCAALACGLETIPVRVHFRDEDWIAFRWAVAHLNGGFKLYQPLDHPDFGWPCWRKDTGTRVALISMFLKRRDVSTVLDIGCHGGAISHGLARRGFRVDGLDRNPLAIRAAQLQAGMTHIGSTAMFHQGDHTLEGLRADAVVCLSALNHAYVKGKGEEMLRRLVELAPVLILDCPVPGDPVGGSTDMADAEKFRGWVDATVGGRPMQIGSTNDGLQRPLFLWERKEQAI